MTEITGTLSNAFDRDTYRLVLDADTTYTVRSLSNPNIISEDLTVYSVDERGISELFLPYTGFGTSGFDRGDITATFTTLPGRTYFVTFSGNSGTDAEYTLAIDEIADDAPDNAKTTLSLSLGESEAGRFETVTDRDWVLLDVDPGQSYRLTSNFNFISATMSVIGLDANGELVRGPFLFPVRSNNPADTVNFSAEAGITYYAVVNNLGTQLPFNDTLEWVMNLSLLPGDAPNNTTTTLELAASETLTIAYETPADNDWIRLDVDPGDSYRIDAETTFQILRVDPATGVVLDTSNPSINFSRTQTFSPEIGFDYYIQTFSGDAAGLYDFTLTEIEDDEPDNITTPVVLDLNGPVFASREGASDVDYIRLDLPPGASYVIEARRSFDETIFDTAPVPFEIISSAEEFGSSFGRTIDETTPFLPPFVRFGEVGDGRLDYTEGSSGLGSSGTVILTPEEGVTYHLVTARNGSSGEYAVTAEVIADVPDNASTTSFIAPNSTILGIYEAGNDQDWVRIDVDPGETVLLQITNSLDTSMKIYAVDDVTGEVVFLHEDGGTRPFSDSSVFAQTMVTGQAGVTIYAQIAISNSRIGQVETYTLSSTPIADDAPDAPGSAAFFFGIENEAGTEAADVLRGNATDEAFDGKGGNDQIFGRLGDDFLSGGAGNDTLDGSGGNDSLLGGSGNDLLIGGNGADFLDGGAGRDTASYADTNRRVQADLENRFTGGNDARGDILTDIEDLIGSLSNDSLRGDSEDNTLTGLNGSDRLFGRGGDDSLIGGTLNDVLYGNAGADEMSGGAGNDRYIYFAASDSRVGGRDRDVITDFDVQGNDRIELFRLDADITRGGNQAFDFIGSAGFSGTAGEIRFFQSANNGFTLIQADHDGDRVQDFQIELTGLVDLTANDFLL
ncbi:MAG: hypothetical protein AAFR17_03875 [Pseudomonadota bacterium]